MGNPEEDPLDQTLPYTLRTDPSLVVTHAEDDWGGKGIGSEVDELVRLAESRRWQIVFLRSTDIASWSGSIKTPYLEEIRKARGSREPAEIPFRSFYAPSGVCNRDTLKIETPNLLIAGSIWGRCVQTSTSTLIKDFFAGKAKGTLSLHVYMPALIQSVSEIPNGAGETLEEVYETYWSGELTRCSLHRGGALRRAMEGKHGSGINMLEYFIRVKFARAAGGFVNKLFADFRAAEVRLSKAEKGEYRFDIFLGYRQMGYCLPGSQAEVTFDATQNKSKFAVPSRSKIVNMYFYKDLGTLKSRLGAK